MSRRKRKERTGELKHLVAGPRGHEDAAADRGAPDAATSAAAKQDAPRRWLLAGTMVLFVARPLFPSESVAQTGEGIVLVMLSLLLAAGWAVWMLQRRDRLIRFGAADAAVLILLTLYGVSGIVACRTGNAREAINVVWAWIGLGVGFFLLRQLVHSGKEARAIVAVMIGLAVALSGYGLYQSLYELPELRADYARDPEGMMRRHGVWYEPGSVTRVQFENRLNSREPFTTFALTNSLAGFLAPWFVVAVGLGALSKVGRSGRSATNTAQVPAVTARPDRPTLLALAVSSPLIAACLLLTKSRSAYLAVLVGLGLVAGLRYGRHRTIGWRLPVATVVVLAVLVVGAIAAGGLDSEILSEAGKSLGYRVQYWQSTLAMIGQRPLLGCGPGQFQNRYSAHKLPEASEEVADPHNFVLEVWATAGTGALLALLAVLACFGWAVWRHTRRIEAACDGAEQPNQGGATVWIFGGAVVGFVVAWPLGAMGTTAPNWMLFWFGLPLAVLTVLFLADWVRRGSLSPTIMAIGLVALLVNLLAAGGIGFPGVAGTFWLLLALGLNESEAGEPRGTTSRVAVWSVTVAAVVLAAGCYWTGYRAVLPAQSHRMAAEIEPDKATQHWRAAAEADPLWATPWQQIAVIAHHEWRKNRQAESLEQFERAAARAVLLNPESASFWNTLGNQYVEVFQATSNKGHLEAALAAYRRAAALYPNHAEHHGRLAIALDLAGERPEAEMAAKKALELDDAMPHDDKKLPGELRGRLIRIGNGS